MIFRIFYDFFGFFCIFLDFIYDENSFKINKKILDFGAGPMWMRRGTQGHMAAPRGPAQRLRGALYILYNLFTIIYKVLQLSLYGKGYSSLINRRVLYTRRYCFFFSVWD